jgi:hypothetical protein
MVEHLHYVYALDKVCAKIEDGKLETILLNASSYAQLLSTYPISDMCI